MTDNISSNFKLKLFEKLINTTGLNGSARKLTQSEMDGTTKNLPGIKSFEDDLMELKDTSDSDSKQNTIDTIEAIQEEIDSKLEKIETLQKETIEYVQNCQLEIAKIFANGTDAIPEDIQAAYNTRYSSIENKTSSNLYTMQEQQGIISENEKIIENAEKEIEENEEEIQDYEIEIAKLKGKNDKKSLDKIEELQGKIEDLNLNIEGLNKSIERSNSVIELAQKAYNSADAENTSLYSEQGSLMIDLMSDYYKTHSEKDRVLEDKNLANQISGLENCIKEANSNLSQNTLKLSNEIQTLNTQKTEKIQQMQAAKSTQTKGKAASSSYPLNNTYQGDLPQNTSLAEIAKNTAASQNTTGWCLRGVNDTLQKAYGFRLSYNSAYQAIPALQQRSDFAEVTGQFTTPESLRNLPAGAIVVWENSGAHPHGHISVALGNGQEASDHIQNQTVNYGTQYHVFIKKS